MGMDFKEEFPPEPSGLRGVRSFVRDSLARAGAEPSTVDSVVLLVSELASNVVEHARTDYTIAIEAGDDVARVEVRDGSSVLPAVRELVQEGTPERGRGLHILTDLALEWGVARLGDGKAVWFVVPLRADAGADRTG